MSYMLADRWGHGSRIVTVGRRAYLLTNRSRRWIAALRCSCHRNHPHWHDVIAVRSERALRIALAASETEWETSTMNVPSNVRARLQLPNLPWLDRLPAWISRPTPAQATAAPSDRLSIFDPVDLGADEFGRRVSVMLAYRNLLIAGEPGAGKSNGLQSVLGHAGLCPDVRLYLFDANEVQFAPWERVADWFVGPDTDEAIAALEMIRAEMTRRYERLRAAQLRKVPPGDAGGMVLVAVDELALYSATFGTSAQQKQFNTCLRDLVARGRAAGVIVVAATQRPSADIVPTSLRDLFAYRWAFRCSTDASSDIILGEGWAAQGYTATDIDPADYSRGIGYLLAEGGIPRRFKAAHLTDADIDQLVAAALVLRGKSWPA